MINKIYLKKQQQKDITSVDLSLLICERKLGILTNGLVVRINNHKFLSI